jgi:alkylation response protein AidB-like acyl-CoA dehydrogenase
MVNTSEQDQLIIETVKRVCSQTIAPYKSEQHYNTVPKELFSSLSSVGLAGLAIPEEYGGLESSASTIAKIFEEISLVDIGPAIFLSVHTMVSGLITRHGTDEQKQSILPKLAAGEFLGAFALTEPGAGSDASALATTATIKDDEYILNGSKCYITSAGFADLYIVFAKTVSGAEGGISAFVVPSTTTGLSIGAPEKKMGAELSPIASLYFDNARVPATALLGKLHQGFAVALSGLAAGRVNIAACANGLSQAALSSAIDHLKTREQFGETLSNYQGLQFMIADMYQLLEASRTITAKAAHILDSDNTNKDAIKLSSSSAKCFATDAAMKITTDAVQLLGGAGYMREYGVESLMRSAKMLQIVEGANQIQRMIIARALLGS